MRSNLNSFTEFKETQSHKGEVITMSPICKLRSRKLEYF